VHGCGSVSIEDEALVVKILEYYHIYTVRIAELDPFCDENVTEDGPLKTAWKHPIFVIICEIQRRIEMYELLKPHFISQPKFPTLLLNFFQSESSKFWFQFLHNQ
jgi:hypothetical protein